MVVPHIAVRQTQPCLQSAKRDHLHSLFTPLVDIANAFLPCFPRVAVMVPFQILLAWVRTVSYVQFYYHARAKLTDVQIEFLAVTPDGELRIANRCQNQVSLLWGRGIFLSKHAS